MTKLLIERHLSVQLVSDRLELDKVLRVEFWQLISRQSLLVVDLFVLVSGLGEQCLSIGKLGVEVALIGTTAGDSKILSILEGLNADSEVGDSQIHAFALVTGLLVLELSEIPVSHGLEVLGVVAQHIGNLFVVEVAQIRIHLVGLECLFKVDAHLGGHLGENACIHACIRGLLEEQVLGLSQAQVAVLIERLFVEIGRVAVRRQLGGHLEELLEDPCGLSKQFAGLLDAIASKVHVASSTA